MKNKKGFEFSFAWIFAIIVGVFIMFFAIYLATKFIRTSSFEVSTVMAKQLSIIFDPLETGLAAGKKTSVMFDRETRIYNRCYVEGSFGKHEISLSEKSGTKWSDPGGDISIRNKYIFSDEIEEGKQIYFFSKTFSMPFKISEIIFLDTDQYCFINPPNDILNEISALQIGNIELGYSTGNCTPESEIVCFGSGQTGCDTYVTGECVFDCESSFDYGRVIKDGSELFYVGSLIYAGIFSDSYVYECNIKRLMLRLSQIALLYKDESAFLSAKGCTTGLDGSLVNIAVGARALNSSAQLISIYEQAKQLDEKNNAAVCNIW